MSETKRYPFIDVAKGIGILLVVAGHVERGLVSADIAGGRTWWWIEYVLYTFHMPLFFFLSGLNAPRGLKKSPPEFLRAKGWTIAYPYVLWSLIQGTILITLSRLTNGKSSVHDLLQIGWKPMAQFWFLYALMICQISALALKKHPGVFIGIATVSMIIGFQLPPEAFADQVTHSYPFFVAGLFMSARVFREAAHRNFAKGLAALVAFGIAAAGAGMAGQTYSSVAAFPACVLGIAAVIWLSMSVGGRALKVLSGLGTASMTIYVMHLLVASGTRIAMKKAGLSGAWLYFPVCVLTGVSIPLAAHMVLKRLNALWYFGLAPLPRKAGRGK